VVDAVGKINAIACRHFPAQGRNTNELPDRTILL
jgi:uncharacterized membrane protein